MSNPQTVKPARKYIMIPEYRPLFALAKAFGPTRGPIERPTPVNISVIGKLLQQTGRDAVSIFEVKRLGPNKFTKTQVQLTLDNYTLTYDEILEGKTHAPDLVAEPVSTAANAVSAKITSIGEKKNTVLPNVVVEHPTTNVDGVEVRYLEAENASAEEITEEDGAPAETSEEEPVAEETPTEEAPEESEVESEETADADEPEAAEDPAAGGKKLTRAERKALRRKQREESAEAN
ncbi:MAG: hypothetical protein K2F99_09540 [Muribaculaceae bacterium]|nr:hypothetical protein [Muribaculaceae bacterium]